MKGILEVAFRTGIGFAVLLLLTRLLGKKQLGSVTIFTYITSIAMGNIAGDMVVHKDIELVQGVAGLAMWAALTFLVEFASLKSSKARVVLDDEPTVVIKRGEIQQRQLNRLRLNMDDLCMLLRISGVFSMGNVDYAILEPNGQLSVLKKHEFAEATKGDVAAPPKPRGHLPAEIIVDGRPVRQNMRELNVDDEWLRTELAKAGIGSAEEVFFAELQSDGSLYVSRKEPPGGR